MPGFSLLNLLFNKKSASLLSVFVGLALLAEVSITNAQVQFVLPPINSGSRKLNTAQFFLPPINSGSR